AELSTRRRSCGSGCGMATAIWTTSKTKDLRLAAALGAGLAPFCCWFIEGVAPFLFGWSAIRNDEAKRTSAVERDLENKARLLLQKLVQTASTKWKPALF